MISWIFLQIDEAPSTLRAIMMIQSSPATHPRISSSWRLSIKAATAFAIPGYVFIRIADPNEVEDRFKYCSDIKDILNDGNYFTPIDETYRSLIDFFAMCSGEVGVSTGVKVDGGIRIEEGPLFMVEDRICKVEIHKRRAYVDFGNGRKIYFALRIKWEPDKP